MALGYLTAAGRRKFVLGLVFMGVCTFLALTLINKLGADADLTALGVCFGGMFGGISLGVASIVWGNVQEHRARTNGS